MTRYSSWCNGSNLESTMSYSLKSAAFVSLSLAAVFAVVAPNLRGGAGSFVVASVLMPALVATPLALVSFRPFRVFVAATGLALALSSLLVHAGISFAMLTYDLDTYIDKVQGQFRYQLAVALLIFSATGVAAFRSHRRQGDTLR